MFTTTTTTTTTTTNTTSTTLLLLYIIKFTMKKGLSQSYLHFIGNKLYTPCKWLHKFYA